MPLSARGHHCEFQSLSVYNLPLGGALGFMSLVAHSPFGHNTSGTQFYRSSCLSFLQTFEAVVDKIGLQNELKQATPIESLSHRRLSFVHPSTIEPYKVKGLLSPFMDQSVWKAGCTHGSVPSHIMGSGSCAMLPLTNELWNSAHKWGLHLMLRWIMPLSAFALRRGLMHYMTSFDVVASGLITHAIRLRYGWGNEGRSDTIRALLSIFLGLFCCLTAIADTQMILQSPNRSMTGELPHK